MGLDVCQSKNSMGWIEFQKEGLLIQLARSKTHSRELQTIAVPYGKGKGRHVKRGEKAISLCMPIIKKQEIETAEGEIKEDFLSGFMLRPHWFVISQTDGAEYKEPTDKIGDFSLKKFCLL